MTARLAKYTKAPVERKEYSIDYSAWLMAGETVSNVTFTVDAEGYVTPEVTPLVVNSYQINDTADGVSYFAEQGDDGEVYKVLITITTTVGQTREDLVVFVVRDL